MPKSRTITVTVTVDGQDVEIKKPKTVLLLDRSGSMASIRQGAIDGVNKFIREVQANKENESTFSLYLFDTDHKGEFCLERVLDNVDIKEAPVVTPEMFVPRGNTPLYDATVTVLKELEESTPDDQAVLLAIMTDGYENRSRQYTLSDMQTVVERCQKKGNYTIIYLGANQDSWGVAKSYGGLRGNTTNYVATNAGTVEALGQVGSQFDQWNRRVRFGSARGMASFAEGGRPVVGSLSSENFFSPEKEVVNESNINIKDDLTVKTTS